jgi:hypothetical protein
MPGLLSLHLSNVSCISSVLPSLLFLFSVVRNATPCHSTGHSQHRPYPQFTCLTYYSVACASHFAYPSLPGVSLPFATSDMPLWFPPVPHLPPASPSPLLPSFHPSSLFLSLFLLSWLRGQAWEQPLVGMSGSTDYVHGVLQLNHSRIRCAYPATQGG